ncbi:plexin-C1 [Eublepharis macularius]|uniref:Plexin-C1 n=1 Tax=Eublepharis macularius TaxID=481883 RepID=A0AA97JVR5_EUBMA|nr:plexin-C1 [Eublepharis macularius]
MAGLGRRRAQAGGGSPCWALPALVVAAAALAVAGAARLQRVSFPQPISNLAVSGGRVLVASGHCLYQLEASLPPSGAQPPLYCVSRPDSVNKILLPYAEEEGGRLLTCWSQPDGVCYLGSLSGPHREETMPPVNKTLGPSVGCSPQGSSVGKMYKRSAGWFLIAATTTLQDSPDNCTDDNALFILQENEARAEEETRLPVHENASFVDVLRWAGHFFFPYYNFSDLNMQPKMAIVAWEPGDSHLQYSQTVLWCANKTRIVSSGQLNLSHGQAFWIGIFGPAEAPKTPTSTALCLFDLQQVLNDSQRCSYSKEAHDCGKTTEPVNNSPFLIHSNLVSVHATVVLKTPVLFLGTENGQLLKVILDEKMRPNCPDILYEIKEETPIFYKLEFDPLDNNFIYLPSNTELRRVQVANCNKYFSCKECLSAMDPYCGWCHLNKRCCFKEECSNNSMKWIDISKGVDKCLKIHVYGTYRGEIAVTSVGNFSDLSERYSSCKVINTRTNKTLCEKKREDVNCTCSLNSADLTDKVQVLLIYGSQNLSEVFEFNRCSLQKTCSECGHSNCTWNSREQICVSSDTTCKRKIDCSVLISASDDKYTAQRLKPMHSISIEPMWVSTLGKSKILVRGKNLTASNVLMEIRGTSSCKPDIIPVTDVLNDTLVEFCLPPSRKEAKSVCIKADGFKCSPAVTLHYVSLPVCSRIFPNISWLSGGRNITILGKNLNVTDRVIISNERKQAVRDFSCLMDGATCHFQSPKLEAKEENTFIDLGLEVEKETIYCSATLQYDPDPKFIYYELTTDMEPELELKIHKENDRLNISVNEIEVFLEVDSAMNITFTVQNISTTESRSTIHCRAKWEKNGKLEMSSVKVLVKVGNRTHEIPNELPNYSFMLILLFIPVVIGVAVFVTQRKSTQLNRKLSEHLELLECELRKEIRDGFAELQMEKLDVVDSFETIPFLDYTHFVLRAFFPESDNLASIFIEDTNQPLSRNPDCKDASITALFALICNKNFLITLIHTLEKQKTFSVKDKCRFASFLTIALQTNLVYLTHILEVLMRDLMEQSSNIQPKLMLRRTESVVEKLLTNWMSVCLSAFLRETVGEPFYLLVTTLNQRIIKGPVDVITCRALYTLNEDWLLWQVTDFSTVALNVIFENHLENEDQDTAQNIQVNVLDCDTIGQAKEKILQTFQNKNGSVYGLHLNEMGLALQSDTQAKELLDRDASSVILENGIAKLNTIGHYEISDGTTVKVFKRTGLLPDVEHSSENCCHLILPNSEAAKDIHSAKHKGKQKFKVKEMYLTKLLSTKVTIHSVVEKLFRSIWTLPNNKAPVAIKYFFDFLDAQAENKKITDPDVVHIWKTNSLPLRFWVNILKNPQFVFDIKKTPHIDGCLSVIAQAFMDAFSLSEQQLGKEAPTNKLLYAKDIPLYKEEVKAFYKAIRELPSLSSSELEEFLTQESKKHENEFKEAEALTEIYNYIARYFDEILNKLDKERGLEEARNQLLNVRALADDKKKCKWIAEELSDP